MGCSQETTSLVICCKDRTIQAGAQEVWATANYIIVSIHQSSNHQFQMDLVWFEVSRSLTPGYNFFSPHSWPGIEGLQQKPITKDLQLKGLVSQQNSTSSALRGECCATLAEPFFKPFWQKSETFFWIHWLDSSWLAFQAAFWLLAIHPLDLSPFEKSLQLLCVFGIIWIISPPADVTNHKQPNWKFYKIYTLDYLDDFTLNLPTYSLIIHNVHWKSSCSISEMMYIPLNCPSSNGNWMSKKKKLFQTPIWFLQIGTPNHPSRTIWIPFWIPFGHHLDSFGHHLDLLSIENPGFWGYPLVI